MNDSSVQPVSASPRKKKVLIFVVCYNAEKSVESVLDRIPQDIWDNKDFHAEVLIIDDQSPDQTFHKADRYSRLHPHRNLNVLYNPKNQGYGGNQKIGYCYAIKKGFDVVVLLHGDGQYAPEYLGQMIQPLLDGQADAVFGSRMLRKWDALKGKMPLYKWLGNQILTSIQNRIVKSRLSEFHSGYRAYGVEALKSIPFEYNSNYFDFDTDIIIQLIDTKKRIKEISIPTFYGNEISRVNGIKYAVRIIRSCILSRAIKMGIYYHPRFDYGTQAGSRYREKFGYPSSHQLALDRIRPGTTVVDIGCGPGFMASKLNAKDVRVISIDMEVSSQTKQKSWKYIEADLDRYDFDDEFDKVDYVLALDVIEHLRSPERFLKAVRRRFSRDSPEIIITTGNVAFFPVRMSLLFNNFNYGSRGILDMGHSRLFTFSSLRRTLQMNGYEIVRICGVPAPFPLALGDKWLARTLLRINQVLLFFSKSLFAYQIAVVARPLPTLELLLDNACRAGAKRLSDDS